MRIQAIEPKPNELISRIIHTPSGAGGRAIMPSDGRDRTGLSPSNVSRTSDVQSGGPAADAPFSLQCRSRIDALAPRQREVLAGLLAGYRNKQIAYILGLSPRTVEIYRAGMMSRLKARSLAQALHIAFQAGLAPTDLAPARAG